MSALLTDGVTWSFSRLRTFEDCPQKYFRKYVLGEKEGDGFFASYGTFVHLILGKFFSGELPLKRLSTYYMAHFDEQVKGIPPNQKIFDSYYSSGLHYFLGFSPPLGRVLGVEQRAMFDVDGYPFIGYIDLLLDREDGLTIYDHKSKGLRAPSGRKTPTKSAQELDQYLRQLYLYSIFVHDRYGSYPARLAFNCYRTGQIVSVPFEERKLEQAKGWAVDLIHQIETAKCFPAYAEEFHCRNICGLHETCEDFLSLVQDKYQ